jgi:di/tripeptidase
MQALMARASQAVERYYGKPVNFVSGSTDCNIPLSMGIPAVCVGCCFGSGAHTREEYVEIDSLLPGLKVAFELILHYF